MLLWEDFPTNCVCGHLIIQQSDTFQEKLLPFCFRLDINSGRVANIYSTFKCFHWPVELSKYTLKISTGIIVNWTYHTYL